MTVILIAVALVAAFLILRRPYLGIVLITASLPAADLLPQTPYVTSVVPLVGAVTVIAFLEMRRRDPPARSFRFTGVHIWGLLLIGWILITHPQAAIFGRDRSWLFTYLQLWVLVWLSGELLDTPAKQRVLMWVFCIAASASALAALAQGRLGGEFGMSVRATGFAEGANTAARYFTVAFVFLNYLRTTVNRGPVRLVMIGGMVVTFLGVFATVSRTGMMLLFTALGFMVLLRLGAKHRIWLVSTYVVLVTLLFSLSDRVAVILRSIVPAIAQGSDTVGLRYLLWQAGWRMWLDNPVAGVGIGQFPAHLAQYAPPQLASRYFTAVTHNMYIAMLAEIGIVGFGLFLPLLLTALRYLLRAVGAGDPDTASLRNAWLVVFLVMLFGGITKTDQADKLLWLAIGVSGCFHNQLSREREEVSELSSGTGEELSTAE